MKKLNNKNILLIVTLIGLLIILIMSILLRDEEKADQAFLEKYNLESMTLKERVSYLDSIVDEEDGFYAAITGEEFIMGDTVNKFTYDLPKDQFYLSFAPYINQTHPCGNHNLVTCRGELKNQTMDVIIKDNDGNIIVDQEVTSMENGFIGLWLPKGISGNITVTYNGLSATEEITTNRDSNTCLTTLKLT